MQLSLAPQQRVTLSRIVYSEMQTLDLFNKPKLLSQEHMEGQGGENRAAFPAVSQHFPLHCAARGYEEWKVALGSTTLISQSEDEGLRKPIREASLIFVIYVNNCFQNCFPGFVLLLL